MGWRIESNSKKVLAGINWEKPLILCVTTLSSPISFERNCPVEDAMCPVHRILQTGVDNRYTHHCMAEAHLVTWQPGRQNMKKSRWQYVPLLVYITNNTLVMIIVSRGFVDPELWTWKRLAAWWSGMGFQSVWRTTLMPKVRHELSVQIAEVASRFGQYVPHRCKHFTDMACYGRKRNCELLQSALSRILVGFFLNELCNWQFHWGFPSENFRALQLPWKHLPLIRTLISPVADCVLWTITDICNLFYWSDIRESVYNWFLFWPILVISGG